MNESYSLLEYFKKKEQKGFTLIEMLVSLGIFSLIISIVIGIFVGGSNYQRKTIELFLVQREGGYLMETVSRELRMASDLPENDYTNGDVQKLQKDDFLEFKDSEGTNKKYCRSDIDGVCDANGDYFAVNNKRISSDDVIVDNLTFYVNNFDTQSQRFVTVSISLKAKGKFQTKIDLQTSVSLRIYENQD
ncbi:type II secretion system protein [Candidatus Parcubacteria bacterium]|nr:type II secretion system protein [Candidatus Parcubacteria bacterium]